MGYAVDFQEVKQKVSIRSAIDILRISPTAKGEGIWRMQCPTCRGNDKNGLVMTEGKGFYCHNVGKGGDVIGLVCHLQNCGALEAAQLLTGKIAETPANSAKRNSSSQRGFDPCEYAKDLKTDHPSLKELGIAPETLERFGAGYSASGVLSGRLCVRIDDAAGEFLVFAGLSLKEATPAVKFGKDFDATRALFNAHRCEGSEVRLVRSILDVMRVYDATGEDCISFLSEAVGPEQFELLAGVQVEREFSVFF